MHHGDSLPQEVIKELFTKNKFGATGQFPEGKLNLDDEGEIIFGVARDPASGKIIINFNKPVAWIGMSVNQAIDLANCLLQHANACQ